jgi:phosphate transport system permease protein
MAATETRVASRGAAKRRPLGAARPRWGERLIVGLLFLCGVLSIATTIGIVVALIGPTRDFFREVGIGEFFGGREWAPLFNPPSFGMQPLLVGTIVTTLWALVICIPFGLGSAIYLSEYASPRLRRTLKPVLEVLAGVPTVVYGFFALTFVTPLLQDVWFFSAEKPQVFNALSPGLVMGIMILPTVASLSEDAMSAVPQGLRAGAFALGSTKLQVSTRVVVPAALSGIVASFVLGVSRAVGETMIVLIAAGGTPSFTFDPTQPVQTMTAFIAATGLGDVSQGTIGYSTIFAVGATLFTITFVMNAISIRLVRKYREVYE